MWCRDMFKTIRQTNIVSRHCARETVKRNKIPRKGEDWRSEDNARQQEGNNTGMIQNTIEPLHTKGRVTGLPLESPWKSRYCRE